MRARSLPVILLLSLALAAQASAQTFDVAFYKSHVPDDDLTDVPMGQPTAPTGGSVHYRLRLGNCPFFNFTGTACQGANPAPLTNGVLTDHPGDLPPAPPTPPFEVDLDCARPFSATVGGNPRGTMTCDEGTNTITVSGITLAPAEILEVTYWAVLTNPSNACNQAAVEYDQNPTPGTPVLSDFVLQSPGSNEPFCINVGGGGGAMELTKVPLEFDCVLVNPLQGTYRRCANPDTPFTWRLRTVNTTGQDLVSDFTDDGSTPEGCFTGTCPPTVRINGISQGWPPAGSLGAVCDPLQGFSISGLQVPAGAELIIDWDARTDPNLGLNCRNWAHMTVPPPLPSPLDSTDPEENCRSQAEMPTEIWVCGGVVASAIDAIKAVEDESGNPITSVSNGDTVCFRLTAVNNGTSAVTGNVTDDFDPRISNLVGNPAQFQSGTCTLTGNSLSCTGVTIQPQSQDEIVYCGTFNCAGGTGDLCNVGYVRITFPPSPNPNPVPTRPPGPPPGRPGPTCVSVNGPDLSLSGKEAFINHIGVIDGCLSPQERIVYTVTVVNSATAPLPATGVQVIDPTAAGFTYDPASCRKNGAPCGPESPDTGFNLGTINPGDPPTTIEWMVVANSVPPNSEVCNEDAAISLAECGGSTLVLAPACVPTCAASGPPDPVIAKSVDPAGPVNVGDTLTYTLDICNNGGQPADKVMVTDPLPPCTEYLGDSMTMGGRPVSDAADGDGGTFLAGPPAQIDFDVEANLGGDLGVGQCVQATFQVLVTTCLNDSFTNTAFGTATAVPDYQSNRVTTDVLTPGPEPVIDKTAAPVGAVSLDEVLTYTLSVCNNGPVEATGVAITDPIPACATYEDGSIRVDGSSRTDSTADGDGAGFNGTAVLVDIGVLGPSACVTIEFQVRVTSCGGGLVENTATGASAEVPSFASNTTANAVTPYRFTKTATDVNGGTLDPGDAIEYAIEICNDTGADFGSIVVSDPIPSTGPAPPFPASDCDAAYVRDSLVLERPGSPPVALSDQGGDDEGTYENPARTVFFAISTLAAGECVTFRFQVTVDPACAAGECIRNAASGLWDILPAEVLTNTTVSCVGTAATEVFRNFGLGSLTNTGGCEIGPRLTAIACSALPGICREDVPFTRWTMIGDAQTLGNDITFYEVVGNGCCAATPPDSSHLRVRKDSRQSPPADVVVELVAGCP